MSYRQAMPVSRRFSRKEGPRVFTEKLDLTSVDSLPFTYDLETIGMSCITTALIDNSATASAFTMIINGTPQKIVVPANSQMIVPIVMQGAAFGYSGVMVPPGIVNIMFLNYALPFAVWKTV